MCVVRVAMSSDILETLEPFVSVCIRTPAKSVKEEEGSRVVCWCRPRAAS